MFNRKNDKDKNFKYSDHDEEKINRRAEILYGEIKYNTKGELYPLTELSEQEKKKEPAKEEISKSSQKRKEEKDYDKIADLLYPTMKNKKEEEKKETPLRKRSLKDFDLNDDDYDVEKNTITPKIKKKEYITINNVKFPNNSGNEEVEKLKKQAKKVDEEIYKEENARYLKGTKAISEKIAVDFIHNPIAKAIGKREKGNEAVENLHMSKTKSYLDTSYAKEHKVYNNYDEAPSNLKNYFKNKIAKQIGADKLEKTKGIYIDADSDSSKSLKDNLLKDEDFISKLKKYDKALKNNYSINNSIRLKDENWKNAVGSADIRDMHINKNGDLELYIADVYDFNAHEKSNLVRVGRDRQDKGEITPYFYAYRVIISKEEKEKAIKNKGNKND